RFRPDLHHRLPPAIRDDVVEEDAAADRDIGGLIGIKARDDRYGGGTAFVADRAGRAALRIRAAGGAGFRGREVVAVPRDAADRPARRPSASPGATGHHRGQSTQRLEALLGPERQWTGRATREDVDHA